MKKRTPSVIIGDMLDSIAAIKQYTANLTEDEFRQPGAVQDAIVRRLEIIGEAAYQLGDATRARFPEIPWQDVLGMRNRIVHGYHKLALSIVWDTIQQDLPPLELQLRDILQRISPGE